MHSVVVPLRSGHLYLYSMHLRRSSAASAIFIHLHSKFYSDEKARSLHSTGPGRKRDGIFSLYRADLHEPDAVGRGNLFVKRASDTAVRRQLLVSLVQRQAESGGRGRKDTYEYGWILMC